MHFPLRNFFRTLVITSICVILCASLVPVRVSAQTLTQTEDILSSNKATATGVSHTISFHTTSGVDLQEISFQFETSPSSGLKPTGLNATSASLSSISGISGSWTLDSTQANIGLLSISTDTPQSAPSDTIITIIINNLSNPEIADCNSNTKVLQDTCWIDVSTYADLGVTNYDAADISFQIAEDASMVFNIEGVPSGELHNGITTTKSSSSTETDFGNISSQEVSYVAQKITVRTNAPNGYTIYAQLVNPIGGTFGFGQISPFGATDATWSTPKAWQVPTGIIPNSSSGWIGANISDTRVAGWSSASAKFGPISTTPHPIAHSDGPDRIGSTIYVTFALGVNILQGSDQYRGNIVYNVQATY